MIEFVSGSTVIDSSPGLSVLFFCHAAIFLSNHATTFFNQKQMFYLNIPKTKLARNNQLTISLTCFNNFNKIDGNTYRNTYMIETQNIIFQYC